MVTRLDAKQIDYIIRECEKVRKTAQIAAEVKIGQRRVQQIWAVYRKTGSAPVLKDPGRPEIHPTQKQIDVVLAAHDKMPAGVTRTTKYLRCRGTQIREKMVYRIMKENGMVTASAAKSRRRKWIRFERKYSNAMWHTDWHAMKNPRFQGYQLITYLDDASRCVVGTSVFKGHMRMQWFFQNSIAEFGALATIRMDNESCFVNARQKMPTKMGVLPHLRQIYLTAT